MKSGLYKTSSGIYKNLQRILLCIVFSVLSFIFSRLTFQNTFYDLPLCTLAALSISIFAPNAAWGAVTVSAAVITLILLEQTFNTDNSPIQPIAFIIYTGAVSIAAALITNRWYWHIRKQRDSYQEQSARERSLSQLSTALLTAASEEELHELTVRSIFSITGCSAVLFIRDKKGATNRAASYPKGLLLYPCDDAVNACVKNNCRTGFGTVYFGENPLVCFPVSANGKLLAVAGMLLNSDEPITTEYQMQTTELLLVRAGIVLDKITMLKREQQILMEKELEHMRSDFLRSISHDFRTPLTGIIGACSMLNGSNDIVLDIRSRQELVESINGEAEWLMRTVENLLSVTRVGSNGPKLNKSPEPIEEILSTVLDKAASRFPQAEFIVKQPDDFIMIPVDPVLIVQVLMNLIENAVKYSGNSSGIELSAADNDKYVIFSVRDHGHGMKQETLSTLFEPSACRSGDSTHGMGLGLSICKSIVAAHGGMIEGHNAESGGAVFMIHLPKENNNEQY